MTTWDWIDFQANLKTLPTSRLIMAMNADALVDLFRDSAPLDREDRKRVIKAIADEIDRRLPVPGGTG